MVVVKSPAVKAGLFAFFLRAPERNWATDRVSCPWRDLPPELGYMQSTCDFAVGKSEDYGGGFGSGFSANASPRPASVDGLHNGTSPPACGRSTKKNGGDQAWGRSRGGLSTKIHAATIDETAALPSVSPSAMPTTAASLNLSMRAWMPTMCSNRTNSPTRKRLLHETATSSSPRR